MTNKILDRSRPRISLLDYPPEKIENLLREKLIRHGVLEAYIFGSFAQGRATAWSDLDLILVTRTDLPFIERPRQFADLFDLGLPLDLLVYSPEEFQELRNSDSGFWRSFRQCHRQIVQA